MLHLASDPVKQALGAMSKHLRDRPQELVMAREHGRPVVGFFPGEYVPEELIHAAGAVPLCLIHGGDPAVVDASEAVTTRFLCPFARAQMGEVVLKREPLYGLVDLLVSPITCQHLRRAGDIWEHFGGVEIFRLGVPYKDESARGLEYYHNMCGLLARRLEVLTGKALTGDSLRQSIAAYNRMRGLLRRIGELRKRPRSLIRTVDFIRLNQASFYLDAAYMGEALEGLLGSLEDSEGMATGGRPRLLLTGPNVACGDYKVLELVEECGADIVVEEIAEGVRCYRSDVAAEGDPLRNLAVKYLQDRVPAAFMRSSGRRRLDFVSRLAREFGAQGIVWYQLLYCDTYDIEAFYFERNPERLGLPMLRLESDYNIQDTGPLRTRVEAFLERIGGGAR